MKRPPDESIIEFKGCTFNDGWEFGQPAILYSPVCRYGDDSVYRLVEDVCIDFCAFGEARRDFTDSDNQEFQWRGWARTGFRRRKAARHLTFRVRFYKRGALTLWEILENTQAHGAPLTDGASS